jgi:DNA-binding NarL/FixJ family response regulator
MQKWIVEQMRDELLRRYQLTPAEIELLRHERRGLTTKASAREMNTTPAAVNSRWQRLIAKLGLPNRRSAAVLAAEHGLL